MTEPRAVIKPEYYLQPVLNPNFDRIVQGGEEQVSFLRNSTIRMWLNTIPAPFSSHWHHALEIIMPVENRYTVQIEGGNHELGEGDICIIPSRSLHALRAPPSGSRMIYLFDMEALAAFRSFAAIAPLLMKPVMISKASNGSIHEAARELLLKMANAYFEGNELREMVVYSLLLRLLALLGDHQRQGSGDDLTRRHRLKVHSERFEDIIAFIDDHYRDNLSLETVAALANYSKYHFDRLFKEYTSFSFHEYLTRRRIDEATKLLMNGGLPVTEIALRTGFRTISSFNRAFKKLKLSNPRSFMQQRQSLDGSEQRIGNTSHTGF